MLSFQNIPHSICVRNITHLLKALCPFLDDEINSYKDILNKAICDETKKLFMINNCKDCENFDIKNLVRLNFRTEGDKQIKVKKLVKVENSK